jgi:SAM-dependent methyltransferase
VTARFTKPQVERSHYFRGYDTPDRFASYWHQIDETSRLGGRVVEIGTGNGAVAAVLRARGFDVTTVDIDEALGPNVVADIRGLPFPDGSFDTVLASEVLEHLDWAEVPRAVSELARVARRGAVVSVPDSNAAFALQVRVPNVLQVGRMVVRRRMSIRDGLWALAQGPSWRRSGGTVSRFAEIGRLHPDAPPGSAQHYWEIGLGGVGAETVVAIFEQQGFGLIRDYRVPGYPYHHFFVFRKAA